MLLDVSRGKGTTFIASNREQRPLDLKDPSALAIKGLGQFNEFRAAAELSELLESWHVSGFDIQDARSSAEAGCAEHLSTRGDNIAQVARFLYEYHPDRFQHVLDVMRARIPGITAVEAKATVDGRLVLRFQDGSFEDPLAGLVGANMKVTLEIEADIPAGAPDHVVRTVTENSRTLKFDSHGFERE